MKLITILLALGLDRLVGVGPQLKRFCWFDTYLTWLQPLLNKTSSWGKFIQMVIIVLPLPVMVGIAMGLLWYFWFGIIGILLGIFVLVYCMGPEDLSTQVRAYTVASVDLNEEAAKQAGEKLFIAEVTVQESQSNRSIAESVFVQSNSCYFAVLFWFLILGPFGAVLYRLISLLSLRKTHELAELSDTILQIMDWVPVRLTSFSYLLVGQFLTGFGNWWDNLFSGLNSNDELLSNCGLAACGYGMDMAVELLPEDVNKAMKLVDRALYVWIVVVALVTIGAWVY